MILEIDQLWANTILMAGNPMMKALIQDMRYHMMDKLVLT